MWNFSFTNAWLVSKSIEFSTKLYDQNGTFGEPKYVRNHRLNGRTAKERDGEFENVRKLSADTFGEPGWALLAWLGMSLWVKRDRPCTTKF